MTVDTRAFRKALGTFPTGIVVVTAGEGENAKGITVNSFSSVSLDPPLVLWCLGKNSSRYDLFTKPAEFTISVLAADQRSVSDRLACSADCSVAGLPIAKTENGAPAMEGALAVFECSREAMHDAGDHVILVGRVTRFSVREDGAALTYFRSRYGVAE
ncbi:flavin reductase (DIM6/NTAB) family NADH-FMN oxidoreductase RutF [Rhizomicrobium palustre]|uniref:Flavin reductase (DIM6/NTAB) family NADH-FMN oxidoreductase RutF n=1 Tax=Rhizomicrobium palustre TaxID=189966 RepID=A0A846N1Z0_9PROT|nr:flavin reductase family protein [Rhizomicrobium palustre]NIK89756.1 flavin reductase (DIM6/NTAB) family NADH-FMN oxidoreductase RutF [Rhizomicrobium palustre]